MSIIIKGMEMPKSCAKCDLLGEYGCVFIGAVGYALTEGRRSEDCPLVELPEHGDLIDRDALLNRIDAYVCGSMDSKFIKNEIIKEMPVIVPAEKGETQ